MIYESQWVGTVFSSEELKLANMEMAQSKCRISTIGKNGLFLGTAKPGEEDGFFCVFDENGLFVSSLNFNWGNECDGRVEAIGLNPLYLKLIGTEYEEDAKNLSYEHALNDCYLTARSQEERDLQEEILCSKFNALKESTRHLWATKN